MLAVYHAKVIFCAENFMPKEFKEFKAWYDTQRDVKNWNFKEEFVKYCRADVEVLSKAVLKFRKMFMDKLDVDPFRYVTLASLCMSIYLNKFLPEKAIVGNSNDKDSVVGREWLIYLNNPDIIPEAPITAVMSEITNDINKDKINPKIKYYNNAKHYFKVDGFDRNKKIAYEFNGCFWHGCRKCHPELVGKYDKTIEKENILKALGYNVVTIWGCEWDNIKKDLEHKTEIETCAREQKINIRDALFGGRTEAFKSYVKCNENQKIYYYGVVSLYPTVNALDRYAVGFKRPVHILNQDDFNKLVYRIRKGSFCGIAKVDIIPPRDLYVPVLPDNSEGKLLFHLNPLIAKTYASVELKLALEKGYTITKIYGAYKYRK